MICNFIKKETPTQVFSSEYHKIFEKSLFYGTPPVAASENGWKVSKGGYTRNDFYDILKNRMSSISSDSDFTFLMDKLLFRRNNGI